LCFGHDPSLGVKQKKVYPAVDDAAAGGWVKSAGRMPRAAAAPNTGITVCLEYYFLFPPPGKELF
jgi:hypothetical protein